MGHGCGFSAVGVWVAVRVVPVVRVVRLLAVRFPGGGLLNHHDGALPWLRYQARVAAMASESGVPTVPAARAELVSTTRRAGDRG
jgi:hypothetical protein